MGSAAEKVMMYHRSDIDRIEGNVKKWGLWSMHFAYRLRKSPIRLFGVLCCGFFILKLLGDFGKLSVLYT